MRPSTIIAKTFPFMLIRLLAYILFFIGICIYTGIVVAILNTVKPEGFFAIISFIIFVGGGWWLYRFVRDYINYLIKSAHVAVIAVLAIGGSVPDGANIYKHGVSKVKKFFVASSMLFAVDRLVHATVKQVQRAVMKVGNFLGFIPGIKTIMAIASLFIDIILNYVDECIMAYIFLNEGQSAWKSAADGVVLYSQNRKTVFKTGLMVLVFLIIFFIASFLIFESIFLNAFIFLDTLARPISFVLTIVFVLVLKWSILDSIIMIFMVSNYIKVAYGTEPSYDLYGKLNSMSKKFRELSGKAQEPDFDFGFQ